MEQLSGEEEKHAIALRDAETQRLALERRLLAMQSQVKEMELLLENPPQQPAALADGDAGLDPSVVDPFTIGTLWYFQLFFPSILAKENGYMCRMVPYDS